MDIRLLLVATFAVLGSVVLSPAILPDTSARAAVEDCENCVDDDADGAVDRADSECAASSDGGGSGLADASAARDLDQCSRTLHRAGARLARDRLRLATACLKAAATCVQTRASAASCPATAVTACARSLGRFTSVRTAFATAVAGSCQLPVADLLDAVGLGYAADAEPCGRRGVDVLAEVGDVAACAARRHECAVDRVLEAAVPRAAELLTLAGRDVAAEFPCLSPGANGGGTNVDEAKRRVVRRCDDAIQRAALRLANTRVRMLQRCSALLFTCAQVQGDDPACRTRAQASCAAAFADLARDDADLVTDVVATCGRDVAPSDLSADRGLGFGARAARCTALGVPDLGSAGAVAECLARELQCRSTQIVESESPRFAELLDIAPAPGTTSTPLPPTPVRTATATPSGTPAITATRTPTPGRTPTSTAPATATRTPTPVRTATTTPLTTPIRTAAATTTATRTATPTRTATRTATRTPTPTRTASPGSPASPSAAPTFPPGFWDASGIPPAQNVMTFKFLNRTNGQYDDAHVFWSVTINGVKQTHSIAEQPSLDMPANSAGRLYVYLGKVGTSSTDYYDFIEHTIGANRYNGNTTRVDAFGVKLALRLRSHDGSELTVGEDAKTFAEDRATTFQRFVDAVPAEFKPLAQMRAPYRILQPGAGGFGSGGVHQDYYKAYIDEVWATNGLTIPKAGANTSGLGAYPNLSAALNRHTAGPGTFSPSGKLLQTDMFNDPSTFYRQAPANYYAKFWHDNGIAGKAYGFPYDDVGGYSTFIAHDDPEYLLVAIGW